RQQRDSYVHSHLRFRTTCLPPQGPLFTGSFPSSLVTTRRSRFICGVGILEPDSMCASSPEGQRPRQPRSAPAEPVERTPVTTTAPARTAAKALGLARAAIGRPPWRE